VVSQRRFHLWATVIWAIAIIPTVLWWKDSILWVALLSCYANAAGHWAAYEGARAEEKADG
jgi:hypothetical protein